MLAGRVWPVSSEMHSQSKFHANLKANEKNSAHGEDCTFLFESPVEGFDNKVTVRNQPELHLAGGYFGGGGV